MPKIVKGLEVRAPEAVLDLLGNVSAVEVEFVECK